MNMAFRRDPHDDRWFGFRSRSRYPRDAEREREQGSRTPRGLGWARRRDVEDVYSQQAAPRGGGRYDRTGEERYARGLEEFESHERDTAYDRNARYDERALRRSTGLPWELDEGGVQFGRRRSDLPGPHRGRGPRGYQRSDERIREDVCEALTEADDVDASGIDVQVASGVVTLTGTVDGRFAKRRAEDLADTVSGVREVQNHLRLQGNEPRQDARPVEGSGR
jgi:hypothetical protein